MRNRSLVIGVALAVGAVIGGLTGGLLAAYWWDFGADEEGPYAGYIVPFYSALGVVVARVIVGFLIAAISACVEITNRTRKRT